MLPLYRFLIVAHYLDTNFEKGVIRFEIGRSFMLTICSIK
jgi:hypothetical protein